MQFRAECFCKIAFCCRHTNVVAVAYQLFFSLKILFKKLTQFSFSDLESIWIGSKKTWLLNHRTFTKNLSLYLCYWQFITQIHPRLFGYFTKIALCWVALGIKRVVFPWWCINRKNKWKCWTLTLNKQKRLDLVRLFALFQENNRNNILHVIAILKDFGWLKLLQRILLLRCKYWLWNFKQMQFFHRLFSTFRKLLKFVNVSKLLHN